MYEAPLRCQDCGAIIEKKPRSKTPKYCASCRQKKQDAWKERCKIDRREPTRRHIIR